MIRLVRFLCFQFGRVAGFSMRLAHYLAASTLTLEELRDGFRHRWQDYNDQQIEIIAGLTCFEEERVNRFVAPGARVLLVGCGSGRDLIPLVTRGCHVTGIEPSPAIRTAERYICEQQLTATLIEGFFEDVPLSGEFDVILFSTYTYSYIPESRRRIKALRKAAAHLAPEGRLLIDYPPVGRGAPVVISLGRMMGAFCRTDWRLEPGDHVFAIDWQKPYYDYQHVFLPNEIDSEVAAAGMKIVFRQDAPDEPFVVLSLA